MLRGGLPGVQAGDPEHRDRGLDLDPLVPAAVLVRFADLAGGVALDEEHLGRMGEPQFIRGVGDLDGADSRRPCPVSTVRWVTGTLAQSTGCSAGHTGPWCSV